MGDTDVVPGDLRQRVPGHALIDELLHQWDLGTIRLDDQQRVVVDDAARGWYLGVLGERRSALELLRLGAEWTVLHSVPVGTRGSDIDHVVIGPGGVFTINTKHSRGKEVWYAGMGMYVGGTPQRYVRNAVFEARRARTRLTRALGSPVEVTGVIAFVDPAKIVGKAPAGDEETSIKIVADRNLLSVFGTTQVLSPDEVERIIAAAVRPETWCDRPTASTIAEHVTKEFLALEETLGALEPLPRTSPTKPAVRIRSSTPRAPRTRARSRGRNRQSAGSRLLEMLVKLAVGAILLWLFVTFGPSLLTSMMMGALTR